MAKELEMQMWDAAISAVRSRFLTLVSHDAVMIGDGYRVSGEEYSELLADFQLVDYEMTNYEERILSPEIYQCHYVVKTKSNRQHRNLAGTFHVSSTWQKIDGTWKLVFNFGSRIQH